MNTVPTETETEPTGLEELIKNALIEYCGMSSGDVANIMQARSTLQVSFAEAAVHVGLASREDVDFVADGIVKADQQRGPGIIESALRRQAGTRIVALKNTEFVKASDHLIIAHDPDSDRAERLRALRTELMLLTSTTGHSAIIAVISPAPKEGRSQLAAELAIAFAQLGRRTMLVDGDLRNPSQHRLFNAPNTWGMSQALSTTEKPRTVGVERFPHLSLLTAGPPVSNPLELLTGGRGERLISDWSIDQEFIIIDTPPITQYADGLALAKMAGRALVVSRSNETRHTDVKDMLRRLGPTRTQILGGVINTF
jgi:protein-tyrosine kinase